MVYLYKNKLPNYAENTHYFYSDVADYVNSLGTDFLRFEEDRYTINGNIAEVQLPAVTDVDDVTYIAWNNGGAWRFFYVRSAVYQSGYAIFTLDVDLWGTYISKAAISNITVTRCNRAIGTGVYDSIAACGRRFFAQLGSEITVGELCILFVVLYSTGTSSLFVNNSASAISVFVSDFDEDENKPEGMPLIDWYVELVSGIYAAQGNIGDFDASVIRAYIIPKVIPAIKTTLVPTFKVKTPSFSGTFSPTYEAAPSRLIQNFRVDIDPNNKYYAGTRFAGLELIRTTTQAEVIYNNIVKQDGLQVIVQNGDRTLDITDAFQVGLTSNDGNFTASEKIARTLQTAGGLASGTFQIMSGGIGYITGALSVADALVAAVGQGNSRYTQGGDGVSSYRLANGGVSTPYIVQINESINNEKEHARLYGAAFEKVVSSIDVIFNSRLLGEGLLTDTYIAAEVRVDGVPSDARDVIAAAIRGGIYAVKL